MNSRVSILAALMTCAQAQADTIYLPPNTVPAVLVGTWKVESWAPSGNPHVDNAKKSLLIMGKTYVFKSNALLTEAGVNKCPGGFSFDQETDKVEDGWRDGLDVVFGPITKLCKNGRGVTLTPDVMNSLQAVYSRKDCTGPGESRHDLLIGWYVVDSETVIGQVNDGFYCVKRVLPVPVLTGAPANPSKVAALNVTVAGSNIASYVAAVVSGSSCVSATYPVTYTPIATKITKALGADGTYTLCVKGKSAVEDLQTKPTQVTWMKDTMAPTQVTLSGTPTNPSTAASLNVTVGGAGISKYRAALKNGTDCAGVTFGAATPMTTKVTLSVGAAGPKSLCVKGIDAAGNEQATPTKFTWTKN